MDQNLHKFNLFNYNDKEEPKNGFTHVNFDNKNKENIFNIDFIKNIFFTVEKFNLIKEDFSTKLKYTENRNLFNNFCNVNKNKEKILYKTFETKYFIAKNYFLLKKNISLINKYFIFNKNIKTDKNSLILFTANFEFTIKILRKKEFNTFIKNIEKFNEYFKNNPKTLLTKFVGVYSIEYKENATIKNLEYDFGNSADLDEIKNTLVGLKIENTEENSNKNKNVQYFILMENLFKDYYEIIYDLKGISIKRKNKNTNIHLNLNEEFKLKKYPEKYKNLKDLKDQLRKDTIFLKILNLMDYSLVIGIDPKKENYSLGIVDYLTEFDYIKSLEKLKNFFLCSFNCSCTDPENYYKRFNEMINNIF